MLPVTARLEKLLGEIVEVAWRLEGRRGSPEVSIVLCDNDFIRQLNREYRHRDEPTDVLSFPQEEWDEGEAMPFAPPTGDDEVVILGDVIISLEKAVEQAEAYGHSFERETGYLLAHGLLHLLGMVHTTEKERQLMREKEEKILAELHLSR